MKSILEKYAQLLVNYCVDIQPGEKLFVQSTTLAEPLIREIYRETLKAGGVCDVNMSFREQNRIFYANAEGDQLKHVSPLYQKAIEEYDAYIHIRAPFNLKEDNGNDKDKSKLRQEHTKPLNDTYFSRTASRSLKRNLCQYPTSASAQNAGMSLEEYEQFVFNACKLYDDNPMASWLEIRQNQQRIVDLLNSKDTIRYVNADTDITFKTKGRTWINSDGQTNMPSGEVYTSPEEDSVNGKITFDYPAIYMGREVEHVSLWVEDGYITKWDATRGKGFLDEIFAIEGTRRFGEAAIGTNYNIQRITKNILFDEKIGGSVHMAIGQSYPQAGGKNSSVIHWDMIKDMKTGGEIFANGDIIYSHGKFLF